jgi:hypothetical protein
MPSPTDFRTMLNFFIFCNSLLRFQSVFRFVVFWSNVLFWLFRCQGIVARKEAPTTSGPALPRGRCRPGHFIRTKEVEWTETGIRTWARFTREGCWGAGLIKFQHFFSNATKKMFQLGPFWQKRPRKGCGPEVNWRVVGSFLSCQLFSGNWVCRSHVPNRYFSCVIPNVRVHWKLKIFILICYTVAFIFYKTH